jgi:hypothetical protein
MQFKQFIQFTACVFLMGALMLTSACKKDSVSGTATSKCDYSPYAVGSKFVFSTTGTQVSTDTITGDTAIGGVHYAKTLSTGLSSAGNPSAATTFVRCDGNGVYYLLDKAQLGAVGVSNFTAKEIQSIKLPAAVGTTWKSDTIKYTTSQGVNVAVVYKMTETAIGGTKTVNSTAYSNGLVTVQIKVYSISSFSGITFVDSSIVTSNVLDKTYGVIETSQNGVVSKALKSSIIK